MSDWDDLRFFLAVAREGSIRAAARVLAVNHSTVSRRIDSLEASLGVRLFYRLPSGYAPTPDGEAILSGSHRIDEEFAAIERSVAGRDRRLSGTVRIATDISFATRVLMPHCAEFSLAHPEIELQIIADPRLANLTKREADIAIRFTNEPPESLIGRRICSVAASAYGAHNYLDGKWDQGGETWSGMLDWIGWDDDETQPAWASKGFPTLRLRSRVNSVVLLLEAAKAGMGIVNLPCFMGDGEPTLRRVTGEPPRQVSAVWVLTHKDLRSAARIRAFIDFITDKIVAQRGLLEGRKPQALD